MAFGVPLLKRVLVKDVRESNLLFVVFSIPVPQKLPADTEDDGDENVGRYALSRSQVRELLDELADRSTTRLEDHVTHRTHLPDVSGR